MKKALFLRTSSKPIPRVKRVALVADELGFDTLFVGAHREENLPKTDNWDGLKLERVGTFYPMLNGASVLKYLKGVASYNRGAYRLLKRERPDIVHFSDVESFFSVFFYSLFYKVSTLYNVHDNFGQRYPFPKPVNWVLNIFEGLIVKYATATIVPERFRAEALPRFCRSKITVVKNTPVDPGYAEPKGLYEGKIRIVFAGWLDQGRGIDTLLELAKSNPNYEIHIAGEGSREIIARLEAQRNCIFHGFLNHEQVLSLTKRCDFVFAHYSPHRIINIFAAPNKLAESLAVGRPVLINSEVKVSSAVSENNCGVVTPYGDSASITKVITELQADNQLYLAMCQRARQLFEESYSWEKVKAATEEILDRL